jgi:pimeloyl-ACP methyl ester carboxylesterase
LVATTPNAQMSVFEGSEHAFYMQATERFHQELIQFLAKN